MSIPLLYWMPKLHKRDIAGSRKYTTKSLSQRLTMILNTIKEGFSKIHNKHLRQVELKPFGFLKPQKDFLKVLQTQEQRSSFLSKHLIFQLCTSFSHTTYLRENVIPRSMGHMLLNLVTAIDVGKDAVTSISSDSMSQKRK